MVVEPGLIAFVPNQSVQWRGMRCRVVVTTNVPNARVDIRLNWSNKGPALWPREGSRSKRGS